MSIWNVALAIAMPYGGIRQFKKEINCKLETFDSHSAVL